MKTCLVTGANGFIGRVLCSFLKNKGCRVIAVLRQWSTGPWDEVLIRDFCRESIARNELQKVDMVFHLAGLAHDISESRYTFQQYREINVEATARLASAAAAAAEEVPRFVYFSSVKTAPAPQGLCVDETWDGVPGDVYGLSKREAERRLLDIAERTGLEVKILRPVLVYGPGMKGNLERLMRVINKGRILPIPDSANMRSMIHVDDLVEAAFAAGIGKNCRTDTYIVSDGRAYSTSDIYLWMAEALGKSVPDWHIPMLLFKTAAKLGDMLERISRGKMPVNSALIERLFGDSCYVSTRIERELNWAPRRNFRDSLPDIVRAFRHSP